MTQSRLADERIRTWMPERIPLGRFGQPADVVGAVLFVVSDELPRVAGKAIVVGGGYLAL